MTVTLDKRLAFLAWMLASAAFMLIGAFGPWVKALGFSVSGTDGSNDGWIVFAAAVIACVLVLLMRRSRLAGLWALLAGGIGAGVTIYDRNNVSNELSKGGEFAQSLVQIGWGLNLAMIASLSLSIAGLIWMLALKSQPSAVQPDTSPITPFQ
jgi:hypothetical protein